MFATAIGPEQMGKLETGDITAHRCHSTIPDHAHDKQTILAQTQQPHYMAPPFITIYRLDCDSNGPCKLWQ